VVIEIKEGKYMKNDAILLKNKEKSHSCVKFTQKNLEV